MSSVIRPFIYYSLLIVGNSSKIKGYFLIDHFIRETLEKKLSEGTTIVMDRYAYSGVAYSAAKVYTKRSKEFSHILGIVFGLV